MISSSLLEFAKTGKIGPVHVNMSRKNVHLHLGTPSHWGSEEELWKAEIWCFGDIEIYFAAELVEMIFSDNEHHYKGGEQLRVEPWIVAPGLARDSFEAELSALNIPYTSRRWLVDPAQTHVIVANYISILFICKKNI